MNKIEKLLKKISVKDRENLLVFIKKINGGKNLGIIKIKNTDFYRVRSGRFRIIFHYEGARIVIDNIRMRSDNTYKNL